MSTASDILDLLRQRDVIADQLHNLITPALREVEQVVGVPSVWCEDVQVVDIVDAEPHVALHLRLRSSPTSVVDATVVCPAASITNAEQFRKFLIATRTAIVRPVVRPDVLP